MNNITVYIILFISVLEVVHCQLEVDVLMKLADSTGLCIFQQIEMYKTK